MIPITTLLAWESLLRLSLREAPKRTYPDDAVGGRKQSRSGYLLHGLRRHSEFVPHFCRLIDSQESAPW
jgi:hypothetical protein